jgi:hypothetical protein
MPELAAARVVGHFGNEAQRPQRRRIFALQGGGSQKSIEAARLNQVDFRRWHPIPLAVGHGNLAERAGAHAKRMAKAARNDFEPLAVGAESQQRAAMWAFSSLQEDEAAVRHSFETHRVGMRRPVVDEVVIERFVVVGLAVAIFIVQPGELIPTQHDDVIVHNFEPQRLVKSRGEALPGNFLERVIEPAHNPDVTVRGANGRIAVGEKIESREKE